MAMPRSTVGFRPMASDSGPYSINPGAIPKKANDTISCLSFSLATLKLSPMILRAGNIASILKAIKDINRAISAINSLVF